MLLLPPVPVGALPELPPAMDDDEAFVPADADGDDTGGGIALPLVSAKYLFFG